jgi:DNA-binding LacI/PurR family transcriptional regulator
MAVHLAGMLAQLNEVPAWVFGLDGGFHDVARVAGVSTATVSRVIRGSTLVSADTRERVLAVIDALGFVPDAYAQGLSNRRKDIIGPVALEPGGREIDIERNSLLFVDQIVHAAEAVLRGTGYSLLLSFGSRGQEFEQRVRSLCGKVDGLRPTSACTTSTSPCPSGCWFSRGHGT